MGTFKTAAADNELMVVQKKRGMQTHLQKMSRLMRMADESEDGLIDRNEFEAFIADKRMRAWLSAQDVDTTNPRLLFDLLDTDGNEQLTLEEICSGVSRLKGPARSADLFSLIHMT